ncbi:MAG: hypothetical protein ABWZ99_13010, partial [Ilumatobacteraceae bacterium]
HEIHDRFIDYHLEQLRSLLAEPDVDPVELVRRMVRDVLVVGAALGPQAVTVGAAELAFGPLLADPARVMASSIGLDVARGA